MVKMVAFWMCKLSPAEVARSDAFDSNRSVFRKALTRDRARNVGRAIARRRALRVLVVNDDQDAADALDKLVRRWGHAARLAYDGRTALKVAAAQHPDIVLLAMEMRLLGGCQVARQLRRDFPRKECFIIAVTEFADDQRRRQYSEAGIDLVLTQPVDPSVVETLLALECERVNRVQPDDAHSFANGAARTTRSRKTAGARATQRP